MHGDREESCQRANSDLMRRVLVAANAPEAHVAVATLESAGIEAVIRGEHMAAFPAGPNSGPSVWVRDEDYEVACDLLGVVKTPVDSGRANPTLWVLVAVIVALSMMLLFGR
jgi:putative signal transducing protein